ncbi:MAG: hypothetical protein KBD31_03195 [Proteobacteria bacterium]|nr:hypothetical protein [Pseudomonadota bacterium]
MFIKVKIQTKVKKMNKLFLIAMIALAFTKGHGSAHIRDEYGIQADWGNERGGMLFISNIRGYIRQGGENPNPLLYYLFDTGINRGNEVHRFTRRNTNRNTGLPLFEGTLEGDIKTALQEIEHRLEHLRSHDYRVQNHGFQALMHTLKREYEAAEVHANVYMQHDTSKLGDPNWPLETHNIHILKNALRERLEEIEKSIAERRIESRKELTSAMTAMCQIFAGSKDGAENAVRLYEEGSQTDSVQAVRDVIGFGFGRFDKQAQFYTAIEECDFNDAKNALIYFPEGVFKESLKRQYVAAAKKQVKELVKFAVLTTDEVIKAEDEQKLKSFLENIPTEPVSNIREILGVYVQEVRSDLTRRFRENNDPRRCALLLELLTQ